MRTEIEVDAARAPLELRSQLLRAGDPEAGVDLATIGLQGLTTDAEIARDLGARSPPKEVEGDTLLLGRKPQGPNRE